VVIPIATLDANYDFDHKQKESLVSKDKYIKRMQRKIARQKKGSRKRAKTKQRIARLHEQRANIRRDFAHKATRKIVDTENKSVFVLENLGTKRMTASAAGTVDEPGKNVAQKSGLNKEILNIGWNQIAVFLTYKAMRAGKVVFKVSPNHTSQECSHCGYTHQDNRPEQELFVCGKCGHTENADKNAARVIGKRAIKLILDSGTELSSKGVLTPKKIKTGRRKAKFSAEAGTTQ
jgi:putative transposase